MDEQSWVVEALRDWGRRHRGEAGAEIGHRRQANFAHLIRDPWNTEDAREQSLPPTAQSCEVDAAVSYIRMPNGRRSAQGERESQVLELIYCCRLEQKKVAAVLGVSQHEVRSAKLTGEASVKMFLQVRCGWGDVNPSLLMFA